MFSVDAIGPNRNKSSGVLKSPLKKTIIPTKNPTARFSFEKCTMK